MSNESIINNETEIDLLQELSKETELRTESVLQSAESQITNEIETAELDPEDVPETKEEATEQPENVEPQIKPKELASVIIEGIDLLQKKILPALYEKQILKPNEREQIEVILTRFQIKKGKQEIEFTEAELKVLSKANKMREYNESLPLSAEEKKYLSNSLAPVLKNANVEMSPETALLIATATVFAPRILPLITDAKNE